MTRAKTRLIEDIHQRLGIDATAVIEYLYECGTLDDCLARQHAVKVELIERMTNTELTERTIHADLADKWGFTRERVGQLGRNISPRG